MAKPKIIIAEDTTSLRNILVFCLEKDFEIVATEDGEQGLAAFRENPDAVLLVTDNDMPRMGGIELIRKTKASDRNFQSS